MSTSLGDAFPEAPGLPRLSVLTPGLCVALAQSLTSCFVWLPQQGRSLDTTASPLAQAAAAASARQSRVVPAKLKAPVPIQQQVQSSPDLASLPGGRTLPAGSKLCAPNTAPRPLHPHLGTLPCSCRGQRLLKLSWEVVVGVPWELQIFVRQAESAPYPKFLGSAVSPVVKELLSVLGDSPQWSGELETYTCMACER